MFLESPVYNQLKKPDTETVEAAQGTEQGPNHFSLFLAAVPQKTLWCFTSAWLIPKAHTGPGQSWVVPLTWSSGRLMEIWLSDVFLALKDWHYWQHLPQEHCSCSQSPSALGSGYLPLSDQSP